MKTRVDSRIYTNMILTVIAVLLLSLSLHAWKVGVIASANAQISSERSGYSNNSSRGPVNTTNVPQVQDVGMAAATREVAAANRDIAAALQQVASSIDSAGSGFSAALKAQAAAQGNSDSAASHGSGEAPTVEVGPK